jgi:hypothetical protein
MKKTIKNLAAAIAVAGAAMVSQPALAQVSFVPNDLYLGFQNQAGGGSADYIINLGPASGIVGGSSVVNLSSFFSKGNFNSSGLVGTNSSTILGGVVGGSNGNTPSDIYMTVLRTGGAGVPSVAGSPAPTGLTRGQDNTTYSAMAQISSPAAGAGTLDVSRSWESFVEPSLAGNSFYGVTGDNPDSSIGTNAVVYEDLYYTTNSSGLGGAKPFVYEGYFTFNLTGNNASVTFTPQATPAQLTGPNILSIGKAANTVTLVWTTVPPHTYQLQYTASLQPTNWINIGSGTIANTAFMTNTDPAATAAIRFYRVTAQ